MGIHECENTCVDTCIDECLGYMKKRVYVWACINVCLYVWESGVYMWTCVDMGRLESGLHACVGSCSSCVSVDVSVCLWEPIS